MADPDRFGTEADPAQRRGSDGIIFDIARKAVAGSVKSLLSTEEGLRAVIGAVVPKEFSQYLGRELSAFRAEFLKAITNEFSRFLGRLDPANELQKMLSGLNFDVHVTVGISRKEAEAKAAPAPAQPAPTPAPTKRPKPKVRKTR